MLRYVTIQLTNYIVMYLQRTSYVSFCELLQTNYLLNMYLFIYSCATT